MIFMRAMIDVCGQAINGKSANGAALDVNGRAQS
jgi:hypothetical protein